MKKLLTVLLTLLMVFTLVGCNSEKEDTPVIEDPQQQQEVVEPKVDEPIVGGYVDVEDGTLTDELKDIFNSALEGLLGATYEPIELVATQVVAGTNYKFLANGTKTTNPITKGTYYITIYKDLQGNVELLDIEAIEENQEPTVDPTQYSYWVVTYDQFNNEVSRTTAKYGTTVKDPDGNDVVVKGNTYFHTIINYPKPKKKEDKVSEPAPAPTPSVAYGTPGLYKNGVLVMNWEQLKAKYPDAFVDNKIVQAPGNKSYFYDEDIDELIVDSSITEIDDHALAKFTKLSKVSFKGDLTKIGEGAFWSCSSLTSVTIPNTVEVIEGGAFNGCTALTSVTLPENLSAISNGLFEGCSSLSSITIPDNVTTIGNYAFAYCLLSSITIPDNVTKIENNAFKKCPLSSIAIPNSVTEIEGMVFLECKDLTSVTLPENLSAISDSLFEGCSSLSSIEIPSLVTKIGNKAFSGCTNLTSINLPQGLTEISQSVFNNCTSLSSIQIPDNVTTIGSYAFVNCPLSTITIPSNVTFIGVEAFSGCTSLSSIEFSGNKNSWNSITKGSSWNANVPAKQVVCIDGNVSI